MQTQKKVDNLNDILKHKISYLNRKQKNKSNINEQNIKVNLKKTTPIKFLLNELLIKQKKSKMNKLPKKIKEKILEQNQKTEKGTNPKIQKIKNLISAINQQTKKRIIKAGGIIRKNRLNCDLAISRAIGDNEYKKFGLIANPYISKKNLSYNEKYCVIASDGIWDFVCDETVYNIGMMCDHGNEFCEKLINVAINVGSKDNISCIVISFRE